MSAREIKDMAELIIKTHDGRSYFNFAETSKIIGCGENSVGHSLHEAGIVVKKIGPSKRVSAYDIATLMCSKRVEAIRGASS